MIINDNSSIIELWCSIIDLGEFPSRPCTATVVYFWGRLPAVTMCAWHCRYSCVCVCDNWPTFTFCMLSRCSTYLFTQHLSKQALSEVYTVYDPPTRAHWHTPLAHSDGGCWVDRAAHNTITIKRLLMTLISHLWKVCIHTEMDLFVKRKSFRHLERWSILDSLEPLEPFWCTGFRQGC